jgi:hypothetical protein
VSRVNLSQNPTLVGDDGEVAGIEDMTNDSVADACEGRSRPDTHSRRLTPHSGHQRSLCSGQVRHDGYIKRGKRVGARREPSGRGDMSCLGSNLTTTMRSYFML